MVGTIKKPTDFGVGNHQGNGGGNPMATQLVMSGKKNGQQSNNSNYMSPYS